MNSRILVVTLSLFLGSQPALARDPADYLWFSLNIDHTEETTRGVGLQLNVPINRWLGLRMGRGYLEMERSTPINDIRFDEMMKMGTVTLMFDLYPFKRDNLLHLTLGNIVLENDVELTAYQKPGVNYLLNGKIYNSAQLGNLTGTIEYAHFAPYAGIGLKWQIGDSHWMVTLDAGRVFNLNPEMTLTSDSGVGSINADLAVEVAKVNGKMPDSYDVYSLGVAFGF